MTGNELKETIYTSESEVRKPLHLIKNVVGDLGEAHALGVRLAKRNIKAQYRQSMLGYVWTVIPPLLTSLIWVFLNGQNVVNISDTDVPYPLFVITGTMLWQIFAESISGPLKGVTSGRAMLTKINFPREALILTGIYEVVFNAAIKIGLIVLVFTYYGYLPPVQALWAFVGIFSLILFGSTAGILLTPLGMLYKDINRGLAVVLQFAIYLTPVIYPAPKSGTAAQFMQYNPIAPLISFTRDFLFKGYSPDVQAFATISLISIILFFVGVFFYRLAMPIVIERVGS